MSKTTLCFATVLLFGSLATPQQLTAQGGDCATNCSSCGFGGWGKEGVNYRAGGPWKMSCGSFQSHCDVCSVQPTRANNGLASEDLLLLIRTGDELAVRKAVALNKDRLRVSADRNVVVLYGTKCDRDAIGAIAYLSSTRAALLRRSGVPIWVASVLIADATELPAAQAYGIK